MFLFLRGATMLKKVSVIWLGAFALSASYGSELYINKVISIPAAHRSIDHYYQSGEYDKDVSLLVNSAISYANQYLKTHPKKKKLAFSFDIDDTLLTSYTFTKKHNYMLNFSQITKGWSNPDNLQLNKPIMPLVQYAKAHNITVFIITGRDEKYRKVTVKDLHAHGISNYAHLYLKPDNTHYKTAADFKSQVRKSIEKKGYTILLNVGDQQSDLSGGYAIKTVKLPNPLYFIP